MANDPVAIAVLAKAPVPGFAKTRLIPVLGADGAAAFAGAAVAIALEPDLRPRVRASDEIGSDLESALDALRAVA